MRKKTPTEIVNERFGSKKELAKLMIGRLEKPFEDESDEDFERRIRTTSNKKLLHLYELSEQLQQRFGSKDKLIDAIVALKYGDNKPDSSYRSKLERYRIARLMAMHRDMTKTASR
ncbi:MAG: hypothetical protein RBU37_04715 [Myxococcota bacterium]|jgi:hypothetical protein|nr:hypothetical protein [Myxococcota bacterium]